MTKILLALTLITAPVAQAACTVYGDGFVTPDYILPGNDKADTVSALLGVELVEVARVEDGDYSEIATVGDWAAVKAGNEFALFETDTDCGEFLPFLGTSGTKDISHVTVYASPIPEPKRSALLAGGLLAVLLRRKRSKKKKKKTLTYNAKTH